MLLTSARVVPHSARACFDSLLGAILTSPSATVAVTSGLIVRLSLPLPPLTVSTWPARLTWTPLGIATGFLPMRDMAVSQFLWLRTPDTALRRRLWRRVLRRPT